MARPLTVTAFGNAQVDTADKKAGTGSLQLDGDGDYLAISQPNGELNVDNGSSPGLAWTVECWAKPGTDQRSNAIISSRATSSTASFILQAEYDITPGESRIAFVTTRGATSATLELIDPGINWGAWNHFAATSNGTTITLWLNGGNIKSISSTIGLSSLNASQLPNSVYIGEDNIAAGVAEFKGWIDEVKISNVCRYTANFTPSPALGTDSNTLVHLKMDGTDGSTTFEDDLGITGSSSLNAAFNIDRADGRTFQRASANLEALFSQVSVQNPSPSMVYLQIDSFIWEDADTWDLIYDNDRWDLVGNYASQQFSASASLTVKGGLANVSGTADLTSTATLQVDARLSDVRGTADLTSTATLQVDARLSDVRGTADLTSTATLSGTGRILKLASLDITSLGDLTVFGIVDVKAKADLASTANLNARGGLLVGIDDAYDYTWDTVPDDEWRGFFTDQWRPSGWFAFDAITLTSGSDLVRIGQADLTSTATVNAVARLSDVRGAANLNSAFTQDDTDARTFLRASADLNSEFTLASGSDNSKSGSATLEAFAAEVTVARLSDVRASAELVSQFTLTSGSDNSKDGSSTLSAQATLTSTSGVTLVNAANLDSQFALESQARILKLANLDITSLGDLAVSAKLTLGAASQLQDQFTQSVTAGYQLDGSANLAAEFTEIVRPTLIPNVELGELAAIASLTVNGAMTFNAVANLEALATEVTVGQRLPGGKANLEAAFTTVVTGSTTLAGRATLEAFAAQLTAGRLSDIRGSATLAGTFAAQFAGELKLLDSQFIYMVLNESRLFGIESETRKHDVLSENRLFDIDPESREYQVLPENRIVDVGYFMQ